MLKLCPYVCHNSQGFWWAFLSGVSEPVGGLVGYLALSGNNDLAFAIVFGLVAGMMVFIAIKVSKDGADCFDSGIAWCYCDCVWPGGRHDGR